MDQNTLDGLPDIFAATPVTKKFITEMIDLKFVMGGSRYMAEKFPEDIKVSDNTDYDFNCANKPEYLNWMTDNGFKQHEYAKGYCDVNCHSVWIHSLYDIQVIVRNDIDAYGMVFKNMTPSFYKRFVWKSSNILENDRNGIRETMNTMYQWYATVEID